MNRENATPAQLGYRWPAEWEPQASVWLSWPRNPDTWPGHFEPVPGEFVQFVRLIAEYEPVNILAGGVEVMAQAQALVGNVPGVTLHDIPTNDAWCRDHGPTFLGMTNDQAPRTKQIPNPKSQIPHSPDKPPLTTHPLTPQSAIRNPHFRPPSSIGNTTPGAASTRRLTSTTKCRCGLLKFRAAAYSRRAS